MSGQAQAPGKKKRRKRGKRKRKTRKEEKEVFAKIVRQPSTSMSSNSMIVRKTRTASGQEWASVPIPTGLKTGLAKFVNCVVNPWGADPTRVVDTFVHASGLWQSTRTFEVKAFFNGDLENDGRFALAASVRSGNLSQPNLFQIAVFDGSQGWNLTNAGNTAAYLDRFQGQDLRLDRFYQQMLTPEPTHQELSATVYDVTQAPLGAIGAQVVSPNSYGQSVIITIPAPATSRLQAPPGQYNINFMWLSATTQTGVAVSAVAGGGAVTRTVTLQYSNDPVQGRYITTLDLDVAFPTTGSYLDIIKQPVGANFVQTTMQLSSIFSPGTTVSPFPTNADYGLVKQLRPVACAVLASCIMPAINTGGTICANRVSGNVAETQFFTNDATGNPGPLQNWENLSQTPLAKSFPIQKGVECWYCGEDSDDYQFYKPSAADANSYPTLIVAGKYSPTTPPAAFPASYTVLRVSVAHVWEFVTDSTLFPLARQISAPDDLALAMTFLQLQPAVMENPDHQRFIDQVRDKIREAILAGSRFWSQNQSWIVPVGQAAFKAGAALLM